MKIEKVLIFGILILLFLASVNAKDFVIRNESASSQNYFVVNGSTGYVGVGTGDPKNIMNIIGDLNVTGTIYGLGGTNISGNLSGAGTANYIPLWSGSSTLNNSVIYQLGGNIGIGTTSPIYPLDVSGVGRFRNDIYADTGMYFRDSSGTPFIRFESQSGNIYASTSGKNIDLQSNAGSVYVGNYSNDAPLFRVYDGGASSNAGNIYIANNLGIGTTGPSAKLHVSGGSAIIENAGVVSLTINDTSSSQIPTINFAQGGGTRASIEAGVSLSPRLDFSLVGYSRMMTLLEGNVGIGTTAPDTNYKLDVQGGIRTNGSVAGINIGPRDNEGNTWTLYNPTGDDLRVFGSSSGETMIITANKKVGIGTTIPVTNLDVVGDANITGTLYAGSMSVTNDAVTNLIVSNNATIGKNLSVSGNALFVDNNTGYVGVGTISPTMKLEVAGDINLGTTSSGFLYGKKDSQILIGEDTEYYLFAGNGDTSSKRITIGNRVYIAGTSGNLGIGTASPRYALDVAGTGIIGQSPSTGTTYTYLRQNNTGSNLYVGIEGSSGGNVLSGSTAYAGVINQYNAVPLQFGTSGVTRMTIDSDGEVGIGTSSPTEHLQIYGAGPQRIKLGVSNSPGTDYYNYIFETNYDSANAFNIHDANGYVLLKYYAPSGSQILSLGTAGSLNVLGDGNVGIGSTAPVTKLDVVGNANVTQNLSVGTSKIFVDGSGNMVFKV